MSHTSGLIRTRSFPSLQTQARRSCLALLEWPPCIVFVQCAVRSIVSTWYSHFCSVATCAANRSAVARRAAASDACASRTRRRKNESEHDRYAGGNLHQPTRVTVQVCSPDPHEYETPPDTKLVVCWRFPTATAPCICPLRVIRLVAGIVPTVVL